MEITQYIIFSLLGLTIGSFLNVCIDRLPVKKSLISPPSHCDSCQHRLSPIDLIPVLSYLWLRGRCRYCGARIPLRPLLVEVLTGLLFALFLWRLDLSAEFAVTVFYCCIFIVIIFIDLEHRLILNVITYPAAIAALIISIFYPQLEGLIDGVPGVINHIIGGAFGFILFFAIAVIKPGGMGWGDVKLAGLIGLVIGMPLVIVSLFLGIVAGGMVVVALLLFKIRQRKEAVPYAPFLGSGLIVALLWGQAILDWYLDLFSI